jgi:hypothetical protein
VLRRIFGPKRDQIIGGWRKFYDEELHNFNSSTTIMRMIKSRMMRCPGHVAYMGGFDEKARRKETTRKIYT